MYAGAKPEIFRKAVMLRNNMTKPEIKFWEFLKTRPLGSKFRRQHPFGIFVLDFYCHSKKLNIELDGTSHENEIQMKYDKEGTTFIKSQGVLELRFQNEDINTNLEYIKETILHFLRADTL